MNKPTTRAEILLHFAIVVAILASLGTTMFILATSGTDGLYAVMPAPNWALIFFSPIPFMVVIGETDYPLLVRGSNPLKFQVRLWYGSQYFLGMLFLAALGVMKDRSFVVAVGGSLMFFSVVIFIRHCVAVLRSKSD